MPGLASDPPLTDSMPGGVGRASALAAGRVPPAAVRGEGAYLVDADGRRLIDANNNFTVLIHGHAHPAVTAAATQALGDGACFGVPHLSESQLADTLVERIASVEQVRFTNSGTEAVQTGVRLARAVTGRSVVVGVRGAYHGSSDTPLAISGDHYLPGVPPEIEALSRSVPLNDIDALERTLEEVQDDLALVVVDLMANYTGLERLTDAFLQTARAWCDRTGALLAYDEVISLRQAVGGMQALYDVRPDLTLMGKLIGGGLPVGAVGGSAAAMRLLDPRRPGAIFSSGTFTGNPVTMAAGIACLEHFDDAAVARVNALGDRLRARFAAAAPPGWEIRGFGSLARVMRAGGSPAPAELFWEAYERGLLLTPAALAVLSTPMDEACVDAMTDILVDAVAATDAGAAAG